MNTKYYISIWFFVHKIKLAYIFIGGLSAQATKLMYFIPIIYLLLTTLCLQEGHFFRLRAGRYLSLLPTRYDLTQGQWPEGRLKWGFGKGSGTIRDLSPGDYDAFSPTEGGPAKFGGLAASSLPLLGKARWQTSRGLDTRSMTRRSIKVGIKGGKVVHEPKLEPCLTVLVIGTLSAMWAWWA